MKAPSLNYIGTDIYLWHASHYNTDSVNNVSFSACLIIRCHHCWASSLTTWNNVLMLIAPTIKHTYNRLKCKSFKLKCTLPVSGSTSTSVITSAKEHMQWSSIWLIMYHLGYSDHVVWAKNKIYTDITSRKIIAMKCDLGQKWCSHSYQKNQKENLILI